MRCSTQCYTYTLGFSNGQDKGWANLGQGAFFFSLKKVGRVGKRCLELSCILLRKDLVELFLNFVYWGQFTGVCP